MLPILYLITVLVTAMILIVLTIFAFLHRERPLGMAFFLIMAPSAAYVVVRLFALVIPNPDVGYLLIRLQTLPNSLVWLHLLQFVLVITGRVERIQWGLLRWLYLITAANSLVIMTDPLHGWFLHDFANTVSGQIVFQEVHYNGWYILHTLYNSIYSGLSIAFMLYAIHHGQADQRRQLRWILVGVASPLLTFPLFTVMQSLNHQIAQFYQPFVFSYVILAFILARTILYYELLSIPPIVHPMVFREIRDALIITDMNGHIKEMNQAAYNLRPAFRAPIGAALGMVFPELAQSQDGDLVVLKCPGQHDMGHFECGIHQFGAPDSPVGTIYMLRDVTQRLQAQQAALEITLERERRAMLTQFIQHAMHEFRTPLSTIKLSAYLAGHIDDLAERERHLDTIQKSADRIAQLVAMMAKMTELQNIDPSFRPLPVVHLLDYTRKIWSSKNIMLKIDFAAILPTWVVIGNERLLHEAIDALIDNAHRFGPDDGVIEVTVKVSDGTVIISVQDAGPGIPPDQLPRIFDTFWRADVAHTTPGLGLGLPIARQIAHLHNGDLFVESVVGKGSRFDLILPLQVNRVAMSRLAAG